VQNLKVLVLLTFLGLTAFDFIDHSVSALQSGVKISSAKSNELANPAPFFRPVLQQLRNYNPPLRLPSSMGSNISGLEPEIYAYTGYLAVNIIEPAPCYFCHFGRIYVNQLNTASREELDYNRRNGASVTLREGIRGFYTRGVMPPKGYTPSLIWEQDGFVYGVSFYAGEDPENVRQYLIDMARLMARQQPVTNC
jgi:hypothetical protein